MITHITVEEAAKLISRIAGTNEMQALTYIREAADRGEIQTADALEKLQAELEQAKAERDAALKDIWTAKWISCKYGTGCDFISARTGRPDCAGCGGWEWRGIKED